MAEPNILQERFQKTLEALWNDTEIGPAVQAKAKELFPDVKTNAEIFDPILAPLKKQLEKTAKELEEEREARAKERREAEEASQRRNIEQALSDAKGKYNLTEEGFEKMVARMRETGNYADAEAAAAWVASKTPPAPAPGPSWAPQQIDFWGSNKYDEALAQLHTDPVGYMDAQLTEFTKDPDGYVRQTFGNAA